MARVPGWRREARACIAREIGDADASWIEWRAVLAAPATPLGPLVLSAVGGAMSPEARARALRELAAALPPGTVVVVVDHNRPRRLAAAVGALVRPPWVPGWSPAARWRRLAHPTARELRDAGFRIDRLRLVAGERVQVVVVTRP